MDGITDYRSLLANEQKARDALDRLSKHFDLEWTNNKIATYINGKLEVYTEIYTYKRQKNYYFSLRGKHIFYSVNLFSFRLPGISSETK
jgi:hypothetical protein